MSEVTGRLGQQDGRWWLASFALSVVTARSYGHDGFVTVRSFARRIDAVAFAARKGIRLEESNG